MNLEEIKRELLYQKSLELFDERIDMVYIQKLFDLLMNEGVFHDEFIEIMYPPSDRYEDFVEIFNIALKVINLDLPKTKETALWFVLKHHIQNIADQKSDSIKTLYQINSYTHYDFVFSQTKKYVGDSYDIHNFIGMLEQYDDRLDDTHIPFEWNKKFGDEAIAEFNADLIDEAKKWLEVYQNKIIICKSKGIRPI